MSTTTNTTNTKTNTTRVTTNTATATRTSEGRPNVRWGSRAAVLAACLVTMLAVPATARAASDTLDKEREGLRLVQQLEMAGHDVRYHAEQLKQAGSGRSRWAHYHYLNEIKHVINDELAPALVELHGLQGHLPEWKQEAVEVLVSRAKALAADMNSAILAKNTNPNVPPVLNAEYQELLRNIHEHAEALVKASDAAGTFAEARVKAADAGLKGPAW